MNILFLSTNYPYPPDSGHNIRTFNILKFLAKENNIFYLAFSKNKEDDNKYDVIKEICKSVNIFFIPDDFSKFRIVFSLFKNAFSCYPYIATKYFRNDMRCRLKEILKNHEIDLIHFDLLPLSRYLTDCSCIPATLTEHNVESLRVLRLAKNSKNIFFSAYMYLQFLKLYKFEKKALSKFKLCLAVSREDMMSLKKMAPNANFAIIPNGVDIHYFCPASSKPEHNSVIWVGGMSDMYNKEAIDYFCEEIFPRISEEISNVKLIAIGKNPAKSLVKLKNSNKNVITLGYVEDIRPYVNSASVFIAPIKSGGGTKLKVLNALSMGKAVVTTSVGVEGIEAVNNENILIADDPKTFAKKVTELLKNPKRAEDIGRKARKLIVEKYDWEIIGKRMNRLYERASNVKYSYKNSKNYHN